MELDDLKDAWAAHGALLARSLAIDERLLQEALIRKARRTLAPYLRWRALEVALGVAAMLVVMPVLVAHGAEVRYVVAAGSLAVFLVGATAHSAHLLVRGLRLDYGKAVTAIQRDVERMKLAEYRALEWALLGGVVVWLPGLLVLFEAVTGVAALAHVDRSWLAANLGFGLVVLAAGHRWSRKNVERTDLGPAARRIVDAMSGRALRSVAGHLAEIARFTREEPPSS